MIAQIEKKLKMLPPAERKRVLDTVFTTILGQPHLTDEERAHLNGVRKRLSADVCSANRAA